MKKLLSPAKDLLELVLGCAAFAVGFNLFLTANDLNAGGLSGLAMVLRRVLGFGSVGMFIVLMNMPLFVVSGFKIGKKFFIGSLIGMSLNSLFIDLFAFIPAPATEPLIGALYGGAVCGLGLGLAFLSGASTGGSDIAVRLLKRRYQNIPIGTISICFDACVIIIAAVVFKDFSVALYSGIAIMISGFVVDAVVYHFDYSKVALIITKKHEEVALEIERQLDRGATYLHGEGSYTREKIMVVLTAVKRHQVSDLKRLVMEVDPAAFVIMQEAHQVLGDGFSRYSKDSL
ncbi:MAG: YitT family protein [Oscillospiraceae bacterium]|nr:YitT family protein [Oscillospiraceae bacterium]MBQ8881469.1 YitT family protein [Oscillospiraceae bacterium]